MGADIPVVAAGGIFDGRGLAAALALGADGVWIGTRFIATPEARSVAGYKDALIQTAEDGTTISRAFSGKTMRVVRNSYTAYFDENPEELAPFPSQLSRSIEDRAFHLGGGEDTPDVDPDRECYPSGQGVGAIQTLVPVASWSPRSWTKPSRFSPAWRRPRASEAGRAPPTTRPAATGPNGRSRF